MEGRGCQGLQLSPDDVICLPKRYASDTEACQAPVLVLPQAFMCRLPGRLPATSRPRIRAPKARRANWVELAEALLKQRPVTSKAARSIRYLLKVGRSILPTVEDLTPLPWHEEEKSSGQANIDALNHRTMLLFPVASFKANLRRANR